MTTTVTTPPASDSFVHPALFYSTQDEYLREVGGFVRAAVEAGEPAFVAVPGDKLGPLRDALGDAAAAVDFADMTVLGRNPGRILSALQGFADRSAGRAARIVGEPIWPARTSAEMLEATRHEALINTAFARRTATILCPYFVPGLPEQVIADARRTHPTLIVDGQDHLSDAYADAAVVCGDCDQPLPLPPDDALTVLYTTGGLADVRDRVIGWATRTALTPGRAGDLVLAVSEATTNSLRHGGGSGTLRLWKTSDGTVIAEISDAGHLRDPLSGRSRPALSSANGGRGLWMIHQLSDLVEIRATSTGLTLRLHLTA
ncbi:anti-sigma factor RsbA family regulatory protein [Streptomyces sp. H39-S7]|uniref:anti-sigma factor RsbA family regulatory protein n=1 Tax=Streptomyces sp. H39-S7 TaxID=3004357 RepID=UPI0022B03046|nr:anti-sigma factor RsbA family regulatory protein [Streptomyces sp. H39-S7]MCZ4120950.1 anti-sigma factor RsbA family regulatory protein [Streptomyces sp. H39-S7]